MKEGHSQLYPAGLYIVATPIGNLGDITLRALEALKQADVIACEDTRVTAKLLAHYGIGKPTLSYNDHNGEGRRPQIIDALKNGQRVALVSDAGTPLISDPGYKLVREVLALGLHVTTLPGASSVLSALCLSGLPSDRFFFGGFLSPKKEAALAEVQTLAKIPGTLVLFESARRLTQTLPILQHGLGDRQAAVVREITKLFEESRRGSLSQLNAHYEQEGEPKGEVVIVIAPPGEEQESEESIEEKLRLLLKTHSVKEAASILAEQTGRARKELYTLALGLIE